jgi:ATP/maltotriose-dependent transcriptional regulator MalT
VTASTTKPRVRRERRIIERPRLIKLLDESEARIILLLAPAGYGKTTLARQWAKTLSGAIWVTLTPAHRDVVTFAEDVASGVEGLGGAATEFIREYLRAQSNPQRAASDVARELSKQINEVGAQWLVLDDYHELASASDVDQLMEALQVRVECRILVASRTRPHWLTSRHVVYGEVAEIGPELLAMTPEEVHGVLGRGRHLEALAAQAKGWPAVIGLAAATGRAPVPPPPEALPAALHRYLADELFTSASVALRRELVEFALLPLPSNASANSRVLSEGRDLGFITGEDAPELHPLLREFLLTKLVDEPDYEPRVREAVRRSVAAAAWDNALGLIVRYSVYDLFDPVLEEAFTPLVRSGLLATLSRFAAEGQAALPIPSRIVDLVEAEVSLREGRLELAAGLAKRALKWLPRDHRLVSHANAIVGQSSFLLAAFDDAEEAWVRARATATDERDEFEATHGLAVTRIFDEREGVDEVVGELAKRRHESPLHLVRYATAEINRRRFFEGLRGDLHIDEAVHSLGSVDDPRARTSFSYSVAYTLGVRAEYEKAMRFLDVFVEDAKKFDLEFAMPFAHWTAGMLALGLRRFGAAERAIQAVEDAARQSGDESHTINAASLRARLLLQMGQPDEALSAVQAERSGRLMPSWLGEYLATRALIHACLGEFSDSDEDARAALRLTGIGEVKMLVEAAQAVSSARRGGGDAFRVVQMANASGVWDPVVCAVRCCPELADLLSADKRARPEMESLYVLSHDRALARRAGFRTRASRSPDEVLSPRELEVLGLIARGLRNREISEALFIANSTTKVHIRHIFEKLGVRTRAEAVARYEMFAAERARGTGTSSDSLTGDSAKP